MIRGLWDRNTVVWIMIISLLPVAAAAIAESGTDLLLRFGVSLAVALVWQGVFLVVRAQPMVPIAVATAFAVALLAPGTAELWQLALAVTFGTVIGEQVFGGWGRNVINAAVAALAFLYFGFPEAVHTGTGPWVAIAVVPAGLLLLALGIIAWQALLSAIVVLVTVTLVLGHDPAVLAMQGSLAFGLVFLVCDPVTSAATRQGRWIYGALAGGLAALLGWADSGIGSPQSIVFATLIASVFAPLIDATVIAVLSRRWRRRLG